MFVQVLSIYIIPRIKPRSITNLEQSIKILETEFEKCDGVRAEIEASKKSANDSEDHKKFFVLV